MFIIKCSPNTQNQSKVNLLTINKPNRPISTIIKEVTAMTEKNTDGLPIKQTISNLDALYKQARNTYPQYQQILGSFCKKFNVTCKLAALKDATRSLEKIGGNANNASSLKDIVRGTIIVNHPQEAYTALDELLTRNKNNPNAFKILGFKNKIAQVKSGYRDLNLSVSVDGHVCEIQIITKNIFDIKKEGHKLYNDQRVLEEKVLRGETLTSDEQTKLDILKDTANNLYDTAYSKDIVFKDL